MTDKNIPPQDIEAEKAVIGAILIDSSLLGEAIVKISAEDFYFALNGLIYKTACELYSSNKPIDLITVSAELNSNDIYVANGKGKYLTACIDIVSTSANWEYYADIVKDKAGLRSLLRAGQTISHKILKSDGTKKDILDFAQKSISEIVTSGIQNNGFVSLHDLAVPAMNKIEQLYADKRDVVGRKTGFVSLDKKSGGLVNGELIIIAGRPSMGKTTFALNIALNVAKSDGVVAIFSLEMGKHNLMEKFIANMTQINSRNIGRGFIQKHQWQILSSNITKLAKMELYIDDISDLNVLDLRAKTRHLNNQLQPKNKKIDLVVVDYLQIMKGLKSKERREDMDDITRNLKSLAKELDIPVIAISQLSRAPEDRSRKNKRPMLSDLKESGGIEQDADVVWFVYREGYYDYNNPDIQNDATIIIAKNRNGETGDVNMIFEKEYSKFSDKEV